MEKKVAHLEMIQGVINRLASNSFQVKSWSVVLVSALFALGARDSQPSLVYIAFLPAIVFWPLDGYFLWQERLFRRLYERARQVDEAAVDFAMDLQLVQGAPTWAGAVFSTTLVLFHGVIVAAVVIASVVLLCGHR